MLFHPPRPVISPQQPRQDTLYGLITHPSLSNVSGCSACQAPLAENIHLPVLSSLVRMCQAYPTSVLSFAASLIQTALTSPHPLQSSLVEVQNECEEIQQTFLFAGVLFLGLDCAHAGGRGTRSVLCGGGGDHSCGLNHRVIRKHLLPIG